MFYYYLILLLIISLFSLNNSLKCKMALISNEVANDVTELSNKKILSQMIDTECDKNDNYCVTYTEITTLNATENFLLHSCESLWRDNIKKARLRQGFESDTYTCETTDGETHSMSATRTLASGVKVSGRVRYSLNCCDTDLCNAYVLSGLR
ncbi:unnamed protein product [Meloidogyne enterolobii]|uniref:Uncharacterized protein n=1 Tax=Meloidogyne enterolobii TaxID=390850 RepID=A0ACB0ZPG8_MELEN